MLFENPVDTVADIHKQMKVVRKVISYAGGKNTPVTIRTWAGTATRYLLLKAGSPAMSYQRA